MTEPQRTKPSGQMRTANGICLTPRVHGVGGMVSFAYKLTAGLGHRGIRVVDDLAGGGYQSALVIGGTRQLGGLWRARRRGILIVQRLDGMNWMHRVRSGQGQRAGGLRFFLRAEYGNFILATIRSRLAQSVIYQSEFSRRWWERVYGPTRTPNTVIYNGVDLQVYTPDAEHERPEDRYRILMVEGSLMGGYEAGLETGVRLAESLDQMGLGKPAELMIVGRAPETLKKAWEGKAMVRMSWTGAVGRDQIPRIDRSAHVLFSSDVNAACPNSVIEALACGLPVVSFDTGALPELVTPDAGQVVGYGGDPWKLDPPDVAALAQATVGVLQNQAEFRAGARQRAEQAFGLDKMVEEYLQVLLES
jgi:glycosyltransferase involved in cell wall biosynthesis